MLGTFGTLISLVQSVALEHEAIDRGSDHGWDATTVALLAGFVGFLFLMYTQTSLFLAISDAALFNLSLMTSDLYAVLLAFVLYGYLVGWMYALALAFIVVGIYIYYSQPEPNPPPLHILGVEAPLTEHVDGLRHPSTGPTSHSEDRVSDSVQPLATHPPSEPHESLLQDQV